MPKRRRSPSAPEADAPSAAQGLAPPGSAKQGAGNEQLLAQLGPQADQDQGYLDAFQQDGQQEHQPGQAPPELEEIASPEHGEAVELAVQEAVTTGAVQAEPTADAGRDQAIRPIAMPLDESQSQSGGPASSGPASAGPEARQAGPASGPAPDLSATRPGGSGSRPLTEAEIAYARRIYGDSIDYSQVRITSDHWLSTGAPKTLGNTMHMRSEWGGAMFDENGGFTQAGLDLLIHELGHVWQFQNGGRGYIGDSLWAQLKAFLSGDSRSGAYDWTQAVQEGLAWEDWNPEQQAQAVEAYHDLQQAVDADMATEADLQQLELLQPYIDKVRQGEGATEFSVPGAVGGGLGGAAVGAGIGALLGGPLGALIGGGLGALIGGLFGGG